MLRFIAASLVVVEHSARNIFRGWAAHPQFAALPLEALPAFGAVGVYVFFGISGFIMLTTQYESFGVGGKASEFLIRRLIRILPIYAIATALQYINKIHFSADYNWLNLAKSLLFIPYIGEGQNFRPVLAQGWTLNLEMFFYLVFGLSMFFSRRIGLMLSVLIFAVLAVSHQPVQELSALCAFYADRILLFFVCGMLLALIKIHFSFASEKLLLPVVACLVLIVSGSVVKYFVSDFAEFAFDLLMAAGCVFIAASYQSAANNRVVNFFSYLGDASYSTYLFHGFVLGGLKFLSNRVAPGNYWQLVLLVAFCVVLSNAVGALLFQWVERPIARRSAGIGRKKPGLA